MRTRSGIALACVLAVCTTATSSAAYTISNGTTDGRVNIQVDGFGAFGSTYGANAVYNPLGPQAAASTTFESFVAFQINGQGYSFLTSLDQGSNPTVTGTPTVGTSSFVAGGLSFFLTQTLTPILSGPTQIGSLLTQTYDIQNTGFSPINLDVIRYFDGDLLFDGSLTDGGGRLTGGATEILFETDSATGSGTSTTFVGITGEGGTIPLSARYEIDAFPSLYANIAGGTPLDNTVTNDGLDPDQFIDLGLGYDVTLALRNQFQLNQFFGTAQYVTRTYFGTAPPTEVVPEPDSIALLGLGLVGLRVCRNRRILGAAR